jgi:hypothetical protein
MLDAYEFTEVGLRLGARWMFEPLENLRLAMAQHGDVFLDELVRSVW